MRVVPGNAQHVGDRENQQDSFGFSNFGDRAFARHGGYMMVLCDGMGGLANGAQASSVAVRTILSAYHRKQPSETVIAALRRALDEAQSAVRAIAATDGSAGTTVVAAVISKDRLYWVSLGDSRLYLCRPGAAASQLTEDHNVATEMAKRSRRGELSEREIRHIGNPEALTGYLGSPDPIPPHIGRDGFPLQVGDRVLVCSDGLYRGLTPTAMAQMAVRDDPMHAAERMVGQVLSQQLKHQDNVTVVVLEVARGGLMRWVPRTVGEGVALGAAGGCAATLLAGLALYAFVLPGPGPSPMPPRRDEPYVPFKNDLSGSESPHQPSLKSPVAPPSPQATPAAPTPGGQSNHPPTEHGEKTKLPSGRRSTTTGAAPSPPTGSDEKMGNPLAQLPPALRKEAEAPPPVQRLPMPPPPPPKPSPKAPALSYGYP